MKRFIVLLVAILFVFTISAVSFAETAGGYGSAPEKKAESAKAEKKKVVQVTGDVTAVDAKAMTVTVKKMVKKEAKEVVITVDDKTKIMMGKDKKALSDIKAGNKVTAKYSEVDGKNIAKSIDIKAEKKEEKKTEPAKKEAPKSGGY
jgi:ribosomal protein S1